MRLSRGGSFLGGSRDRRLTAAGLLIVGAGGHGRVVADAAAACGVWSEIAFADDRYPGLNLVGAWPVVGKVADIARLRGRFASCVVAVGNAGLRLRFLTEARDAGLDLPIVVHPRAIVSPHVQMGAGTVVVGGAVINIGSELGEACIVNTGATVDHDCRLGHGVHVCPGAHLAGDVHIGARTWFGIGAVARQGVRIGADVTVGAGAVCVADIRDGVTVFGVPAKESR
jgi:sugar O-acyltransferase (sialic acid O-acetyltransferase NeuD family)